MHKIPDTFCPAKWDELYVSFEMNYAYSCCKGKTTKFTNTVLEFVDRERWAMLQGQQDPSCDYCWNVERDGGKSLRHHYLEKFNVDTYSYYQHNTVQPKLVQVSLGNECNFQCTYCNPKFSSQWEHDVKVKPYQVFSDRFFYSIDPKQPAVMENNIKFLGGFDHIGTLSIIGGEPLFNKKFFYLIDTVNADELQLSTNLAVKQDTLDRFLCVCNKFNLVTLRVSIDATGSIAEFTRHGLDYTVFCNNLNYLIANAPANLKIIIGSVMSSITIRDLSEFSKMVIPLLGKQVDWHLDYCRDPKIQSMHTLPDQYKTGILDELAKLEKFDIRGVDMLKSVVANTTFNRVLHQELKHFMQEFSQRKNIEIPLCLD
jgi:sulfatase maturation enzyme AslB (radical SAM superfamily)